jgi:hypothetical protein
MKDMLFLGDPARVRRPGYIRRPVGGCGSALQATRRLMR